MNAKRALPLLALALGWSAPLTAAEPGSVDIRVTKESRAYADIEFRVGGELVARYNVSPQVAKPYFWPLRGPGGVAMTRGWPMAEKQPGETDDHVHQKSAWFCHGDIIPEGVELQDKIKGVAGVDFWSESKGHGRIVCTHVAEPKVGRDHGRVTTRNEWRAADGGKVLDEVRTIHFYDFGDTRLIVCDSDLEASAAPVTFGDTKEGSFGIRINDLIREQAGKGRLENAEGKVGEPECWGQVSAWCDYSGPLGGKVVGLAVLAAPQNPHPTCWHSRGYGLMAANPFGRARSGFPAMRDRTDLVKLAKGERLKLRYGILLHPGDAKEGRVAEYYQKFSKLRS